jgi:hypothetical protein
MVNIRILAVLAAIAVFGITTFGQTTDSTAVKRSQLSNLSQMVGTWRGSGWIQQRPGREEFSGTEVIQKKLDGLAMLFDGKFVSPQGKVVHETLGVLTYDETAKNFKFSTFLANGISGVQDLKIVGGHYEWGFQVPKTGTVRYTITIDGDTWSEIGEFSRDGKTWAKTFEMKLTRVKLKRPPGLESPSG